MMFIMQERMIFILFLQQQVLSLWSCVELPDPFLLGCQAIENKIPCRVEVSQQSHSHSFATTALRSKSSGKRRFKSRHTNLIRE